MNNLKRIILIPFLILNINLYADSTKFFDDNATDDNNSNTTMIGDDEMSETDIDSGIRYRVNMGVKSDTVTEDESGRISIKDEYNVTTTGKLSEFNHEPYRTEEFKDLRKASSQYFLDNAAVTKPRIDLNSTEEDIANQWSNLQNQQLDKAELQKAQNKYIRENGSSLQNNKEVFIKARSPYKGGNAAMSGFSQNIMKFDTPKMREQEDNATKYYKEKVGTAPGYNPKQELIQRNIGALSNAYQNIDDVIKKLTEKLNGSKISCQITRNLIPSFFCPITSLQGLRFPGTAPSGTTLHDINQDEEKEKCDEYCRTPIWDVNNSDGTFNHIEGQIPCVSEEVMNPSDINITIPSGFELYPNYNTTDAYISFTTNGIIPIKNVTYTFEILNPNQTAPTDEGQEELDRQWDLFLRKNPLTLRYNLALDKKWNKENNVTDDTDTQVTKTYISMNRTIYLNSSKVKITMNFEEQLSNKYYIELKKPYFRYISSKSKFVNAGAKIEITEITSEYMSSSYFYCTGTQFVGTPSDCRGPTRMIMVSGQPSYLCDDIAHRIGPIDGGGFYNNNTCIRGCVRRSECLSTYSHYSNDVNTDGSPSVAMLSSSIDCLESPTVVNGACSKEICENYFKDDIFPINEILVAKDNTNIYTVKDGALTDHPRPKVDYDKEITNPNLELAWQEEEKDAAYRQMIRDLTYNRIKYRIGEDSPANIAVKEEKITYGQTRIVGYLKPKSNDFSKTSNIYAVLRLEHWFRPIAGSWLVNGSSISVGSGDTENDIRFKDVTYAIKTDVTNDEWKVFRRIESAETLVEQNVQTTNPDGTVTVSKRKVWVKTPAYASDKFGFYSIAAGVETFAVIDKYTHSANAFTTTEFKINQNYFVYPIVDDIQNSLLLMPGGFIRNQMSINNGTDYRKTYLDDEIDLDNGSHIVTYHLYLTYSENQLSFNDLMIKIEGGDYANNPNIGYESQFGLTEMVNKVKYKTEIEHDGEITNNIKPILKGEIGSQTVSIEWKPKYNEKGKKAYKFIFLYNDSEASDWNPVP